MVAMKKTTPLGRLETDALRRDTSEHLRTNASGRLTAEVQLAFGDASEVR